MKTKKALGGLFGLFGSFPAFAFFVVFFAFSVPLRFVESLENKNEPPQISKPQIENRGKKYRNR